MPRLHGHLHLHQLERSQQLDGLLEPGVHADGARVLGQLGNYPPRGKPGTAPTTAARGQGYTTGWSGIFLELLAGLSKSGVSQVAFTPDGRLIVSGSQDALVKIWDTKTGAEVGIPAGER